DDVRHLRAAGAHGGERLVARRVEEGDLLAVGEGDVICADVLRDATGFTRDDVRLADVVEQRRLAVVDVTHDRHDRRTRNQILGLIGDFGARVGNRVVGFTHRLESELARDELDLIEVEALIDRDHQSEILHREGDDLRGRNLEARSQLAHRDELVHAYDRLLALDLGSALRFHFLAVRRLVGTARAAARGCTAHGGHRLGDVRRYRFLIDRTALSLLALAAALIVTTRREPRGGARRAGRRRCYRTRRVAA